MRECKLCGQLCKLEDMAITNTGRNTGKIWRKNVCVPCDNHMGRVKYRLRRDNPHPGPEYPCEICGIPSDNLHLDHDWRTDEFRGWLCSGCNTSLGKFNDDVNMLKKAAEYLMRTGSNSSKEWL